MGYIFFLFFPCKTEISGEGSYPLNHIHNPSLNKYLAFIFSSARTRRASPTTMTTCAWATASVPRTPAGPATSSPTLTKTSTRTRSSPGQSKARTRRSTSSLSTRKSVFCNVVDPHLVGPRILSRFSGRIKHPDPQCRFLYLLLICCVFTSL